MHTSILTRGQCIRVVHILLVVGENQLKIGVGHQCRFLDRENSEFESLKVFAEEYAFNPLCYLLVTK